MLNIKIQLLPDRKRRLFIPTSSWLILFKAVIAVYSEIYMKCINTLWVKFRMQDKIMS
jgi:hypothetical protein